MTKANKSWEREEKRGQKRKIESKTPISKRKQEKKTETGGGRGKEKMKKKKIISSEKSEKFRFKL